MKNTQISEVVVYDYVNRIASTGRGMHSLFINIHLPDFSGRCVRHYWNDMPYRMPKQIIKRIRKLVRKMAEAGYSDQVISSYLCDLYYMGLDAFPKKSNCSDYARFLTRRKRKTNAAVKKQQYYNIFGRKVLPFMQYNLTLEHKIKADQEARIKAEIASQKARLDAEPEISYIIEGITNGVATIHKAQKNKDIWEKEEFITKITLPLSWKGEKINGVSFLRQGNKYATVFFSKPSQIQQSCIRHCINVNMWKFKGLSGLSDRAFDRLCKLEK